jgi:DNA-binding transcriptional LysR family regulator
LILDAGHGGEDGGATGVNGALEKDLNLSLTGSLAAILRLCGYTVIETRTEDRLLYTEGTKKGHKKQSDLENRVAFTEKYPDLEIKLTNRTTGETLNYLKSGKVDVGFVNLPITDGHFFEIKECMSLQDVFVVGGRFMDACQKIHSYSDLKKYPVLLLEKPSNTRVNLDNELLKFGVKLTPTMELGSIETLIDFAKGGLGITCVPREYILQELKSGELKELKFPVDLPPRAVGMVKLRDVPLTFAVQQFIKALEGEEV